MQHTGYPVRAAKRVQLNMFLKKVNQIPVTDKLKTLMCPILWIDEVIEIKTYLWNDWNFVRIFNFARFLGNRIERRNASVDQK